MFVLPSMVLKQLANLICAIEYTHPMRVAIDGVDAAGKTTLANELSAFVAALGRPVIRSSIDGFHYPRKIRYQQGSDSPEGYYRDSFNYTVLQRDLLFPLGPGGDRKYRSAVFNFRKDTPADEAWREAPVNSVLLFDGVFLLRPELIGNWDFSIFIDVDLDISMARGTARDVQRDLDGSTLEAVRLRYLRRYIPGQELYLAEAQPRERASIIVDNNDLWNPGITAKVQG